MAYFANGTEGLGLDQQCDECLHGMDETQSLMCPVCQVQVHYNYEQLLPGMRNLADALNMLVDKNGVCQMKKVLEALKLINHEDNEISELEKFDKERSRA